MPAGPGDAFGKALEGKALEMWLPPPSGSMRLSPVRHVTPARGRTQVEEDLLSEVGVPTKEFWDLWEKCEGCGRIFIGWQFAGHTVCDLTGD